MSEGASGVRSLSRILGPLEVEGGGPLGGPQQRALLRCLLLSPNSVVSVDRLVDPVWGERPPERAREALQVYVSHLRKAIPDGAARIRWEQGGGTWARQTGYGVRRRTSRRTHAQVVPRPKSPSSVEETTGGVETTI